MNENNNHIIYTAADIEKYWKGELSSAEQHAIEKAALDDPFLADAIEGYEPNANTIILGNDELKKRLAQRIGEKKSSSVIAFSWWKAAAIFIVLIGAGWLYTSLNSNHKSKSNDVAIVKPAEPKAETPAVTQTKTDTSTTTSGLIGKTDSFHDVAINKQFKIKTADKPSTSAETENDALEKTAAAPVAAEGRAANDNSRKEVLMDSAVTARDDVAKQSAPKKISEGFINVEPVKKSQGYSADNLKNNDYSQTRKAKSFSNSFSGNVQDQSHKPLANASIQIPGLNVATQTDNKGYFSFNAQDTLLSVSIASPGFETQNINLRNKAVLNQIVLQPVDKNLREVVVQSNGAEVKNNPEANDISIKILDAEPVKGWAAYKEYLQKNKKVDDAIKNIHGTVIVSFTVHKNNWLNDFTIEQSLDEDLDAEAIRLIKEGPAWKLLKGKKATVTVNVKF